MLDIKFIRDNPDRDLFIILHCYGSHFCYHQRYPRDFARFMPDDNVSISEQHAQIADAVMHEMDRGITLVPAVGMYRHEERNMLFCVVSKKELITLKEYIKNIDAGAFVIVTDAREVLGEGFLEY